MNRLYRVTISERAESIDLGNHFEMESGIFDVYAKNGEEAGKKALKLAKIYNIPNPFVSDIEHLHNIFLFVN